MSTASPSSAASTASPGPQGSGAARTAERTRRPGRLRLLGRGSGAVAVSRSLAVLALVALVGLLPWLSSNDPALTILRATSAEREATPEVLDAIRERLGLNAGPVGSIRHWLSGLIHGDPGVSWISGDSVGPGTLDAFGVSLVLMGASLAVALVTAALLTLPTLVDGLTGRRRSRGGALAAALTSLPEYLLAPVLLLILSVYLGWLPPYGWGGPERIVLPALSLGLPGGGLLGGLLSDAVAAVFAERWVTTWTTAGIGGRGLALAVLRRALTPLTGQVTLVVVGLTGGAVAVEKVFAIPGIGRALLGSATAQDVPALQAGVLLLLVLALVAGALAVLASRALVGRAAGAGGLAPAPPVERTGEGARVVAVLGAAGLVGLVLAGIGRDPYAVVGRRLEAPSWALPLGADALGRDVLARVAHGAVATAVSALVVTVVCAVIGLLLGLAPSASGAALAVACVAWAPLAAHAGALVQEARERPDVALAPALGEGRARIMLTRVLPGVVPVLARHAALRLPGVALALAGLGFLGLGAQAPTPEWGLVLAEALPYIERAPWAVTTPAGALVLLSVTAVAASRSGRS